MKGKKLNDIVVPILGVPYKLNGDISNPQDGIDCFGMIRIVMFGLHGVMIPEATAGDYALYESSPSLAFKLMKPYLSGYMKQSLMHFVLAGDIVGESDTVGIYTGNGNFLCAVTNDKVQVLPIRAYHFYKVFKWADQ